MAIGGEKKIRTFQKGEKSPPIEGGHRSDLIVGKKKKDVGKFSKKRGEEQLQWSRALKLDQEVFGGGGTEGEEKKKTKNSGTIMKKKKKEPQGNKPTRFSKGKKREACGGGKKKKGTRNFLRNNQEQGNKVKEGGVACR